MTRKVIFIPHEIKEFTPYLSSSSSNFVSITPSSLTEADTKEITGRGKKYVEFLSKEDKEAGKENPDFDRPIFEDAVSKKLKVLVNAALYKPTDLVVIAKTALLPKDLNETEEVFKVEYVPKYKYSSITVESFIAAEPSENKTRIAFFVSGKDADEFASILTRGHAKTSKIISNPSIPIMDTELQKIMKHNALKLLVVNTTDFSDEDTYFYTRTVNTRGYLVHTVRLPAVEKKPAEENVEVVTVQCQQQQTQGETANAATVKPKPKSVEEWFAGSKLGKYLAKKKAEKLAKTKTGVDTIKNPINRKPLDEKEAQELARRIEESKNTLALDSKNIAKRDEKNAKKDEELENLKKEHQPLVPDSASTV